MQRVTALNRFLHDVYHEQEIVKAGIIPLEQISGNAQFRQEMVGVYVPNDIYSHIAGIDIVRAPSARATASTTCWRTTCACPAASATCWKTAR